MTVDIIEEEQGLSLDKEGQIEVHLSKRPRPVEATTRVRIPPSAFDFDFRRNFRCRFEK